MSTKTAKPTSYPLDFPESLAYELVRLMRPACRLIEVAGSIRRQKATVHDIDLVLLPVYHDLVTNDLFGEPSVIKSAPEGLAKVLRQVAPDYFGDVGVDAKILRFAVREIPVEIYLAERDGSNYEALLQMRTGSMAFNAFLAQRAHLKGLYYRAGYGIYESDKPRAERVDDGTERGIFAALGLAYVPPEKRY